MVSFQKLKQVFFPFFSFWLHHTAHRVLVPFSSVQFSRSVLSDSVTPWIPAHQASLSITNSQSPPKPMSIESVMPSNHLLLCHPLLLLSSIFCNMRLFSSESVLCTRWPKYWSKLKSFSISPCNEYSGLISFRIDWFDLLAVVVVHGPSCPVTYRIFPDQRSNQCSGISRWSLNHWARKSTHMVFRPIHVVACISSLFFFIAKYFTFSFSNSPCNEYSGLISFRIDWLDLLEVLGTLSSTHCLNTNTTI